MKNEIRKLYKTERTIGWPASDALRNAHIRAAWDSYGNNVHLNTKWDEALYDDSFIDTWDIPESRKARIKKDLWSRIEKEGVTGIIGEYFDYENGKWKEVDSCWGFIGDDWENSGYDTDIMAATIEAYREHLRATA